MQSSHLNVRDVIRSFRSHFKHSHFNFLVNYQRLFAVEEKRRRGTETQTGEAMREHLESFQMRNRCVTKRIVYKNYISLSPFLKLASEHVACYSDMLSFILAQDKMWRRACVCGGDDGGGVLLSGCSWQAHSERHENPFSKTMIFRGIKTTVSQAARNVSIPTQRRAIQSSLPCSPWRPRCLIPSDGPGKSAELLSVRVRLQPASPNQVKVSGTKSSSFKWIIRACDYGSFSPADASG